MNSDFIIIRGARQHNLKNIDIDIPRNSLVVITGLSGSGKSTLAFDTLYAEGQRRYVESLSTYARQFLERLEKPDVDMIEGLSPAIAIEQKTASHNPRSTVGTITEIYDYLRLLYARIGTPHCHLCGRPITSQTIDQMIDQVMALPEKTRIIILSPVVSAQKGSHEKILARLKKEGFARVRVDGSILEIERVEKLDKNSRHQIDVIVDRLVINERIRNRLADSIELAMAQADGWIEVDVVDGEPILFSEKLTCISCGVSYPAFTPASFSFNSPQGACPECDGMGSTTEFDPDLIIPNPELSLRDGAVAQWANRNSVQFFEFLDALTSHYGVDIYTPVKDLPEHFRQVLLYGSGKEQIPFYFERDTGRGTYQKTFEGLIPKLRRQYIDTDSAQTRDEIRRYMSFHPCPECRGTRLNPVSRSVTVNGVTLPQVTALTIEKAYSFFSEMTLSDRDQLIAERILKEITERLGFLNHVGLTYLTLDRAAYTLSGGESQRIRLATQIGSKLTGVLYVLDEPSIGLHQRDNQRLLETLMTLKNLGNTVIVVEHDEDTIMASDFVVDMGPGAGMHGGEIMFSGPPDKLLDDTRSLTGQYLSGRKSIPVPSRRRSGSGKSLIIEGACENNLKHIRVEFPLGCFICVTGVSGSGKSTLVLETVYPILARHLYHARIPSGSYSSVSGVEAVDKVIHIDQSPIGKTPRSNPGTYTGIFTHIRELFSKTRESRVRGYKPGRFSFNIKGGRCEACGGDGIVKIEMHFLPDVYVSCDVCGGKRYNRETLEIQYKGCNIDDVLNMTVNQGLAFFTHIPPIRSKLETLVDVGLGYIHIGQAATTLSGGEAQRIKLGRELSKKGTGNTLYILDEPTTGLHTDDISRLLIVLNKLVDMGNTVIVIEHNLDVIKSADHIIDLGPEGGDAGGYIVGTGSPEQLAQNTASYTGQFLNSFLHLRHR
ncbi:MAG: excinuclease ABC subunit UvrA [Desulfobacterales bacterium]|nr:excinuclease ABC subunit UvrA [Desulfobacterales bacterium]MDD4392221.1 excinuclease ABC subunit UvrA [Desulfobacterales bacterium]